MVNEYLNQIITLFKNKTLNALGVERNIYQHLNDNDVYGAVNLMTDNTNEVDNALREYYPQKHDVMHRPNKARKNLPTYITEKLPRARQRYINEVELFFLLGQNIKWKKAEGEDEAYGLYINFLSDTRWNTLMRKAKRIAGAETESAIVWHLYNEGEIKCTPFVVARSTGYQIRTLINQYGKMQAFAYGYVTTQEGRNTEHWDILTSDINYYCTKEAGGWKIDARPNITDKICAVYFKQPKAWDGVEMRIRREEHLDSKLADTNNYFADPIAKATADVINSLVSPETIGGLIQLTGSQSSFEYVNPPQDSNARLTEHQNLKESILFDTFTPDFSYESLKGLGTLSGAAMQKAMTLGMLKRQNRIEIYGEGVDRAKSVMIAILKQMHPEMACKLDELVIEHEFAEPFGQDKENTWKAWEGLYANGLCSIETAVENLALTKNNEDEVNRILMAAAELAQQKQEVAGAEETATTDELKKKTDEGN